MDILLTVLRWIVLLSFPAGLLFLLIWDIREAKRLHNQNHKQ